MPKAQPQARAVGRAHSRAVVPAHPAVSASGSLRIVTQGGCGAGSHAGAGLQQTRRSCRAQ
eukprot:scaffold218953_cov19-Tisochrysis_lutea.AAC.1